MIFISRSTSGGDGSVRDRDSPARLDRVDEDGGDGGGGRLRRATAAQEGGKHGGGLLHFSSNPRCWRRSGESSAELSNETEAENFRSLS